MMALIVGLILIGFTIFAGLPQGLGWYNEMLLVLKGGVPIFTALIGLISIFVGVADIRDRQDEKKEEQKMKEQK
jgi:hypothetical protein